MDMSAIGAGARYAAAIAASSVSTLAAIHVISGGDATTITNSLNQISSGVAQIAAGLGPLIALAVSAYGTYCATKNARIAAVNAGDNGVKVVDEKAPVPQVDKALK